MIHPFNNGVVSHSHTCRLPLAERVAVDDETLGHMSASRRSLTSYERGETDHIDDVDDRRVPDSHAPKIIIIIILARGWA